MNSSMWLIIRKDLRRFWPVLTLWCAALVLRVGLGAWLDEARMMSGREEALFAMILVVLLNIHLICRVISEDSPVKEAAFWRMRPVSGGQMLRAKLVFLGVWTVALPMVLAAVAGWSYGFTMREAVGVVVGQGVLHTVIGLGFGMLAIMTQRVLVSLVGLWLVAVVGDVASREWRNGHMGMTMNGAIYETVSLDCSRTLVMTIIGVLACGSAAAWVYAKRNRWGAIGILGLGLGGAGLVGALWSWDVLSAVPALKRLEPIKDGRYQATVLRMGMESGSTVNDVSFRHFDATLKWSGAEAGEVCATYRIEGRLTGADGREITQSHEVESSAGFDMAVPLREMGIGHVQASPFTRTEECVTFIRVRAADLEAFKGQEVSWRGQVSAKVGRLEIEARVPLQVGAVYQSGAYQFRVGNVERSNAELRVTFVERRSEAPTLIRRANASRVVSGVMPLMYALINAERGEAMLANGGGGGGGSSDGYFKYGRRTLNFDPRDDLAKLDKKEWAEWLRGAELVSFRFVEHRRIKTEVSAVYRP